MNDHEISEELVESKRLTIEDQKEYQCVSCVRLCRAYAISEPLSCVFNENQAIWKKVDKRWKPRVGESYWIIELYPINAVNLTINDGFNKDENLYNCGNCFKTREEAERALEKVKELLVSLHGEDEK